MARKFLDSMRTGSPRSRTLATPLKLKRHHAIIDGPGFESAQARCCDHLASRIAQRGLPMLPIIHSVIKSGSDALGFTLVIVAGIA